MSSDQITVKGPEGQEVQLLAGATVGDAVRALGWDGADVLSARVDDEPRDLDATVSDGARVDPIPAGSEEGRAILRHSAAHIMAQAVTDLWPDAKFAIGPPIAEGFYYDFDVDEPFTPDDLERVEARMREIVSEDQPFRRRELSREEALELFADQPYKRELIESVEPSEGAGGEAVSVYDNVRPDGSVWPDLCRGPHLPTTRWLPAFTLQRVAGAHWRGDEHGPMLQRIYGTAWESQEALDAHLHRLEEARKRDHRVLGRDLDLISFPEELGAGLAVWHPKGAVVRTEMEEYARTEHRRRGYEPVYSPHLGRSNLWQTSGHLDFYADSMYPPMEMDGGAHYYPKPMNCPFHVLIFGSRTRSYRELPLRLFELGTVYRHERSGVVHGLLRARGFTQDDSHLFCTPDQLVDEIAGIVDFTLALYRDFGFTEGPSRVALATRPEKAKTVGSDEGWEHAETSLHRALDASGLDWVVEEGEGAFYGPKVDFQITDAIGRAWQLTTIQVDFNLPERFELSYTGADGLGHRPIMIHRALYGSLDRFFGILLEHYAGALPTWLAPVQAVVVPIADRHHDYGARVLSELAGRGLRVELDDSDDKMGAKIRTHQMRKVPYQLIVGDAEAEAGTVAVRPRADEQRKDVPLEAFASELAEEVAARGRGSAATSQE